MSPNVVNSTLSSLLDVLEDLKPHIGAKKKDLMLDHYEIERQVQLCVDLSATIARRMLIIQGMKVPATTREVFSALADAKLITHRLSDQMSRAVGLRNLLVHEYGKVDYDTFFNGLPDGYKAFVLYAKRVSEFLAHKKR